MFIQFDEKSCTKKYVLLRGKTFCKAYFLFSKQIKFSMCSFDGRIIRQNTFFIRKALMKHYNGRNFAGQYAAADKIKNNK